MRSSRGGASRRRRSSRRAASRWRPSAASGGRDEARDPEIYHREFGESSIDFDQRIWLTAADEPTFLAARSAAIVAVKAAFDEHGIVIPFPIRTLDLSASKLAVAVTTPEVTHERDAPRT